MEDKLSNRLHEELTKTFIDKRASVLARGLKQDMEFETKILENHEVMIDNQFIGKINGLKLELDLKKGALETDIKSLKKAARQTIGPELQRRIKVITETGLIDLINDFKIYWNKSQIAKIIPGKDYLNPNIELIVDDMLEQDQRNELTNFLENSSVKALAYQLYESNGVLKREQVHEYLEGLGQGERKILRDLGVKFGRYHIYLHKLIKPEAVSLRTLLWKNFHQKFYNLKPPTFGLNFVNDNKITNRNFMLLCGFEKFENIYIRIDILERLFVQIINSKTESKKEIKMTAEMLNLLGCNKDNFKKLIKNMNYNVIEKEDNLFFKYKPKKSSKKNNKKISKESPFNVLKNLNLS